MKYKINLITSKKEKLLDRVIFFVLNYLRYILVITQIVVIGVFFYRFKVDQELVDLEEATQQKKEIIQVSQPLIVEAKKQAYILEQTKLISTKQQSFEELFDYLLSVFPESLYLKKLTLKENSVVMTGYSNEPQTVNSFINRLKRDARFRQVEMKNIEKGDEGLEFSFEFTGFKSS